MRIDLSIEIDEQSGVWLRPAHQASGKIFRARLAVCPGPSINRDALEGMLIGVEIAGIGRIIAVESFAFPRLSQGAELGIVVRSL